jgi:hypothetical protein
VLVLPVLVVPVVVVPELVADEHAEIASKINDEMSNKLFFISNPPLKIKEYPCISVYLFFGINRLHW